MSRSALADHPLARALAGTGVGVGALAADGEPTTVTQTAVAAEVHEALDVHLNLAPEIALDAVLALDDVTESLDLRVGELLDLGLGVDLGFATDLLSLALADAEDVGKRVSDLLTAGKVDACNTGHGSCRSSGSLPLLVAGVVTNDADHPTTAHDFALVADLLDAGSYLHRSGLVGGLSCRSQLFAS